MTPTVASHQRNKSSPVGRVSHESASSDAPVASLQKTRRNIPQNYFQSARPAPSTPLATVEAPFDPKSILPASKSQKSLSKLSEASSSSSANQRIRSFSCIDGTTRTFPCAPPSILPSPPTLLNSTQTADFGSPAHHLASTSDADCPPHREQFKAFGIEAYPTRARLNEICYDFVSNRRWCPHGQKCYRVHPLHKTAFLAEAIHESVQITRERREQLETSTVTGSPAFESKVQSSSSSRSSRPVAQSSSSHQPRVNLPRPARISTTSGLPARPIQESHSPNTENELDLWAPQNDMRQPPWANHSTSDTSSSSDDGLSMWEVHTDARDWELSVEDDELLYGQPTPQLPSTLPSTRTTSTSNNTRSSPILYQNQPSTDDSDATVRHPRPKSKQRCQRWLRNECELGYDCSFIHDDLDYDTETPPQFLLESPRPQPPEKPKESAAPETAETTVSPRRRLRPKNSICGPWLRDECDRGYNCKYVHNDLVYDDDEPDLFSVLANSPSTSTWASTSAWASTSTWAQATGRTIPECFSFKLHDHMRVRVGPGFHVEEFTTGFESQWVTVANLPRDITDKRLLNLLRPFGEIIKIVRLPQPSSPLSVRVQFSRPLDAYTAFYSLHGTTEYGRRLDLRMAVETKPGGSFFQEKIVRIDWDAPHRNVYMGYPNIFIANEVVAKARRLPYDDFMTQAKVHIGLPAVGQVTVKFSGLPVDVTEERMEEIYGPHQGMVTERPNYNDYSVEDTIKGINKLLQFHRNKYDEVDFRAPPYKDGKMRAWVHCKSLNDAREIAQSLHNRKPKFTGGTRIMARHLKSITYSISPDKYRKAATEIQALAGEVWRRGGGYSLKVADKLSSWALTLSGEDIQVLRRLKADVEQALNGQLLLEHGVVAWDDFLGRPSGFQYLQGLEVLHPGILIERDASRRTIRLFGAAEVRVVVHQKILEKIGHMRTQKTYIIPLEGRLINTILVGHLQGLQDRLGFDNVTLDLWDRLIRVRGDKDSFAIVQEAVTLARAKEQQGTRPALSSGDECPVCFNEPTSPMRLPCGHLWCQNCLRRYFTAAIDQKFFPITCLGNEGKCKERISLYTARELMSPGELEAIVNGALSMHVQTHPTEYHYCPTPDCSQVYPAAPEGVTIQCPSCLVRICPNCQTDSHDGLTCSENKNGEELFQSWAEDHNVKQCPGCKISIEKDEGCNHMMCTLCKTHICWVCMKTFPNGEGIYAHMGSEHGSFGLGPMI